MKSKVFWIVFSSLVGLFCIVFGYLYFSGKLFSSADTSYPRNMAEMEVVFRLTDANNQRINLPLGYSFTLYFRDQYGSSGTQKSTNYCYGQPGNEPDTLKRGCVYRGVHSRTLVRNSYYTVEGHCPNNPQQKFTKQFVHNPYGGTKNIQYVNFTCNGRTPTPTVTATRTATATVTRTATRTTTATAQTANAKVNINATAAGNKPSQVKAYKTDYWGTGSAPTYSATVDSSWNANFSSLPTGRYKFYVCDGGPANQVLAGACTQNNNKGSKTINVLFGQINNTAISYGIWQ